MIKTSRNIDNVVSVSLLTYTARTVKIPITTVVKENKSNVDAKIKELETVLKNHYDALILLLEKHDMVDTDTSDGSNVSTN